MAGSMLHNRGMGALAVGKISMEEYFKIDDASDQRFEFHDGELFPVTTMASFEHSVIAINLGRRMAERLDGGPCFAAAVPRVRATAKSVLCPDIAVICGRFILASGTPSAIINPKVIVEILSSSTSGYDYGEKFSLYRELPTFEEYLLVAQDKPRIEVFRKTSDVSWVLTRYDGLQAVIQIGSLGIEIPAIEVYAGVEFPAAD